MLRLVPEITAWASIGKRAANLLVLVVDDVSGIVATGTHILAA